MSHSISVSIVPKINYACYQNDIAILKELKIENNQDKDWENLSVKMTSNSNFVKTKIWNIQSLKVSESIAIKDRNIELNSTLLRNLEEATLETIKFSLLSENEIIEEIECQVNVLAYNEWGGMDYIPELLASFVMPNSTGIDTILGETGRILAKNGKDAILNGYENNSSAKIWDMISALYTILANKNFTYCLPPQSFENNGQKIRLTKDILQNKVVTCLDASLLFASAIEQMGLNPVIILIKEHAFVGVWLKQTSFGSILIDDAESVRKRVALNEILIFDAIAISNSPVPKFSTAKSLAEEYIAYGNDDNFGCLIDIKLARQHKIMPMSFNSNNFTSIETNEDEKTDTIDFEVAPADLPDYQNEYQYNSKDISEVSRLNIWQKKLLNLSPTNPLLNCKITQTNLEIVCSNPAELEDYLAGGEKMSLVSADKYLDSRVDKEIRKLNTGEFLWKEQALAALKAKQLLVKTPEAKLNTQLVALYRKTKSILEEGGSNTLYLAIGFLNWRKKDKKDKIYHAPLILCPVKLERSSVLSGVKLSAHEDESRFNSTLLEMLKQDFEISIPKLEGELPTDDSGLDVEKIWNYVRLAIKEIEGFEVVEDVVLGHFSFNKYLMWKDLIDRTDAMMKHPVVASIIDKNIEFPDNNSFITPEELDKIYKPKDFFAPLPIDSSQLAVLANSDKGKSFVIEGPPGTGKSQTISNLISHLMAKGKSVLFVSEKMAALDVVYRRLNQIGLGRFCLQLHSNKANKKDVLNQLRQSWETSNTHIENKWLNKSDELLNARNELNNVVKTLHTVGNNGLTPYYAMGMCIKYNDFVDLIQFNWQNSDIHTEEDYQKLKDLVHKIQIQVGTCKNELGTPSFNCISNISWEPTWQENLISNCHMLYKNCLKLKESSTSLINSLDININVDDTKVLSALFDFASIINSSKLDIASYAFRENGLQKVESLEIAISHLNSYIVAKEQLNCICPKDIWKHVDGNSILEQWNLAEQKWFIPKFLDEFAIKRELKKAGARGNIVMPQDAKSIALLKEHGTELLNLDSILNDVKVWKTENSDLQDLEKSKDLAKKLRKISTNFASNPMKLTEIRSHLNNILISCNDLLEEGSLLRQQIDLFIEDYKIYNTSYENFEKLCLSQDKNNIDYFANLTSLEQISSASQEIIDKQGSLKDWCYWQSLKHQAIENNLKPFIDVIELSKINYSNIDTAFEAAYCNWWIKMLFQENQILREFSSRQHMDRIKKYIKLDNQFQEITKQYIEAKLSQNIPSKEASSLPLAWKTIHREMQKQKKIKPVRQILADCNEAIRALTPCLMMSPLSVAQYLPVSKELFDVVVFDEASQITVWDAIGALSRGKQIIVAGDTKQMPPSNFFGRNIEYNEDECGVEEDLESILDELIGSSMPKLRLTWHYRSKCESLIAFSNDKYYEGSLITFPSAKTNQKSVSYQYVPEGCYEHGGARINQEEAKALVKTCVERLTNTDPNIRNKSIGIVTFNSEQQKLIEDLLDKERELHPEIEFAFNMDNPNYVFVKNLETVQGDERDIILFSVTYGPDKTGKVSMNFGPLNKSGGERRLNVAFTRAKYEMIIFSTLQPEQIDLSRTNAKGVEDLKAFLQYAKQGKSALAATITRSLGGVESPFEEEVANLLKQKGWTVHTQIGTSSYRIDLAIVNPDKPGAYLAGIECDGAMYHSSATARDRDKLRQAVLEGLGWTIIRIWSTDWWTNKKGSLEDLDAKLKKLYEQSKMTKEVSLK